MSRTLKQRLEQLNSGLEQGPLLSESDVRQAMNRTPLSDAPTTKPSWAWQHRTPLITGTAAVAMATILALAFLPEESAVEPITGSEPTSTADAALDRQVAPERLMGNSVENPVSEFGEGGSLASTAEASRQQLAVAKSPNGLSTTFLELSAAEHANLGLTVTTKSVRYTEGAFNIIVAPSGVASKGTRATPTDHATPRHVSVYRNGKVFASWFDTEDPTTTPNDLVPVHVHLENPSNSTFPIADVILWYEPTDQFLSRLTPAHQRELGRDLQSTNGDAVYVERSTHLPSVSSSLVFPNPVRSDGATLRLQVASDVTTSCQIVDINGRVVVQLWDNLFLATGTVDQPIGPLSNIANGMYLVVVTDNSTRERLVQRLLIER